MSISEKPRFDINLEFIFCGLYTLSEFDVVFKKLNLQNILFSNTYNTNSLLSNFKNFSKFYKILNNRDLRIFSYILLTPLRNDKYLYSSFTENGGIEEEIYEEVILLKRYLRKFKYTYFKYFYYQNRNSGIGPTVKELNTIALKFLFLLVGI